MCRFNTLDLAGLVSVSVTILFGVLFVDISKSVGNDDAFAEIHCVRGVRVIGCSDKICLCIFLILITSMVHS